MYVIRIFYGIMNIPKVLQGNTLCLPKVLFNLLGKTVEVTAGGLKISLYSKYKKNTAGRVCKKRFTNF